jgi:hypothetical protein
MQDYTVVYSSQNPYQGNSTPMPEAIYNLLVEETNFRLSFGESIKDKYGYLFGIYDESKKMFHAFKILPLTATLDQIRKVVEEILSGKYESIDITHPGGGTDTGVPATSVISIDLADSQSGGLIPIDLLPAGLRNFLDSLFNALGLGGLKLPWWLYAAIAAYGTTKILQKNSNKIIWGAVSAFTAYTAAKQYNASKKENKTA